MPITPTLITNSADAAIGHAMLGGGLTMALGYQVVDAVKAKKLQVVLEDFEPPPLPIHVLYPSTRLLTAKVRAFVDLLIGSRGWRFTDFRSSVHRERSRQPVTRLADSMRSSLNCRWSFLSSSTQFKNVSVRSNTRVSMRTRRCVSSPLLVR